MSQVRALNEGTHKQSWTTPRGLFAELHREFVFTMDAAASPENALLGDYLTEEMNALSRQWSGRAFCNPPFARCCEFVRHAAAQVRSGACQVVVMLVPVRSDVGWWHDVALSPECEIRWIRGRLRYGDGKVNAPFPSCILVLRRNETPRAAA